MNKYELAVVISANVDDEKKNEAVDKCKALIERFGQEQLCLIHQLLRLADIDKSS